MMQERRLLRADGRKLAKRTGERAAPVVDDWGDDDVQLGAEGDEKGEEGGGRFADAADTRVLGWTVDAGE